MKAGRLRHRVDLQKMESTQDEAGQVIKSWVTIATVWAEISAVSGRDFISAGAEQKEGTDKIWIRYRPDIDQTWRILHPPPTGHGEIYSITAVLPDNRRTRLEIICSKGVKR